MSKKAFAAHIKASSKKPRRVGTSGGDESSIPQTDHTERDAVRQKLREGRT